MGNKDGLQIEELSTPCKLLEVMQASWGQMNLSKKTELSVQPQEPTTPPWHPAPPCSEKNSCRLLAIHLH